MTVQQILPYIDKEAPFVILDQNNKPKKVEIGTAELILRDIMNKPVTQITQFRYSAYDEESFTALRVVYDSEVIE